MLPITTLYAGLLGLWFLVLGFRVSLNRSAERSLGDGGDSRMLHIIRAHANFAEFVPMMLLMLGLLEYGGTLPAWLLHGFGLGLLIARLAHGASMSFAQRWIRGRFVGALLTYALLLVLAAFCVWRGLAALMVAGLSP